MKQFVILFLLFTISPISFTFAQNKIFCEIIEQIVSQKKTRMKKLKSSIPGWKHLTLCPHWVGNSSKHM